MPVATKWDEGEEVIRMGRTWYRLGSLTSRIFLLGQDDQYIVILTSIKVDIFVVYMVFSNGLDQTKTYRAFNMCRISLKKRGNVWRSKP